MHARSPDTLENLLVVLPSWVGDVVMATPALRALRETHPRARITYLLKPYVRPVVEGGPWHDALMTNRSGGLLGHVRSLRPERFDAAVLLPNSFRVAWTARLAGIPRRIGYDRDGRGGLLTDRLLPRRERGRFVPVPAVDYYLGIARYLGAEAPDTRMALFTGVHEEARARALLQEVGVTDASGDGGAPLVLLVPGAKYGQAKLWAPERFARVADRLVEKHGATCLLSGSPGERPILDAVHLAAKYRLIDLPSLGCDLGMLKSVIRRCSLVVSNDTGPRHIAAALETPVVTLFGPTDPRWTRIDFAHERQVMVEVPCGPCQRKVCPLDHRCMTRISPEMVLESAGELLDRTREPVVS